MVTMVHCAWDRIFVQKKYFFKKWQTNPKQKTKFLLNFHAARPRRRGQDNLVQLGQARPVSRKTRAHKVMTSESPIIVTSLTGSSSYFIAQLCEQHVDFYLNSLRIIFSNWDIIYVVICVWFQRTIYIDHFGITTYRKFASGVQLCHICHFYSPAEKMSWISDRKTITHVVG